MEVIEAIRERHSVRQYEDRRIEEEKRKEIDACIEECNKEGKLHIQAFYEEPNCFDSFLAHYGKFEGVSNYIVMVGEKAKDLDVRVGFYGEKLVLLLQRLGLNSCWVALTHGKTKAVKGKGEKQVMIIPFGYGRNKGVQHKVRDIGTYCEDIVSIPDWAWSGIKAATLAPTAMNQQKFMFRYEGDSMVLRNKGGFYSKIDLGIVQYHFEVVTGKKLVLEY